MLVHWRVNTVPPGVVFCGMMARITYRGSPTVTEANVMHGQGRFRWPDGRTYVGSYRNGLRWGSNVRNVAGIFMGDVMGIFEWVKNMGQKYGICMEYMDDTPS